jgi:hypothetical protein
VIDSAALQLEILVSAIKPDPAATRRAKVFL